MNHKVALIHTGPVLIELLKNLFSEILPNTEVINIMDDSLLTEVIKEGKVNKKVTKKICYYMLIAEGSGAKVILNVCSSVSEAVDIAKKIIYIPIIKIDEPMAELAVKIGSKIGVVATLETTIKPTIRLIENKATEINKQISITSEICQNAFRELINGNRDRHDEIVSQTIKKLARNVDLIVLAQGSMAVLGEKMEKNIKIPLLTSPRLGVKRVRDILNSLK
jgi:Asp/Glu/hydantoin racemase